VASPTNPRPRKGVRLPAPETPAQELPAAPETGTVPEPADPRLKHHTVNVGEHVITLGVIVH
jgi:hypothetical protein